ncbi:hypothetical protein TNCV_815271 [Trichonephila clavipes]|nr:hypothetical protein TNCV_815271 [Trichonephila clavipes]
MRIFRNDVKLVNDNRTQLEARFVTPQSPRFQPDQAKHHCILARQCAGVSGRSNSTIKTLKSVTVHPFLPASSNGRIASTYMTSDSPICAQSASFNPMIQPLLNSESCS